MNSMREATEPKSDQINADDLISGPMSIEITLVDIDVRREQRVWVSFVGSEKFYRPSKSMCRIMALVWGEDHRNYKGRFLTLYRDPDEKYGATVTGGIKISHICHLAESKTFMLTRTRGSRKPHTVHPFEFESNPAALKAALEAIAAMTDKPSRDAAGALAKALKGSDADVAGEAWAARMSELKQSSPPATS